MSRATKKNPSKSFEALVEQHRAGKPQPPDPGRLTPKSIKVRPEVFQHRKPLEHASDSHVRGLTDAAKAQGSLAPVTVWWDGKHWNCIDGHHRMQAYMRANLFQTAVPVQVFKGTPMEALAFAAGANTKAKLQMSPGEKANAAWRLVVMGTGLTKAKQAEAAGVSTRLVAYMRNALEKLVSMGQSREDAAEMSWLHAKQAADGKDATDWSEEEEERRVEVMAAALRKALGSTAEKQPDIFVRALEAFSPMLAKRVEENYVGAFKEAQGMPDE